MIKAGDVFSIGTSNGLAFFQYVTKNKLMGQLIRVLPGEYVEKPDLLSLVAKETNFWIFFPLNAAFKANIVHKIENIQIPDHSLKFPLFRTGVPNASGFVKNWGLWDGDKSWLIGTITDEQRKLPIRGSWNDTMLISRIEQGWLPEKDSR